MKDLYTSDHKTDAYYRYARKEVIDLLSKYCQQEGQKLNAVMEVGCGAGATGKVLKDQLGIDHYYGLELMDEPAAEAAKILDRVEVGNIDEMIEKGTWNPENRKFDALVFLDVLEHVYNPWKVVDTLSTALNPGGLLIASIPNAGHFYVFNKLVRNRFEYDDEGLLDRTHIRFFTLHTIQKMLRPRFEIAAMHHNVSSSKNQGFKTR